MKSHLKNLKILIIYDTKTGSTQKLGEQIAQGVENAGLEAVLRRVPAVSITTEKVESSIPETGDQYVTLNDLEMCNGLILGSPTRFGNMSANVKHFLDQTTSEWFKGSLIGKPAALFTSTSTMHGGQESTLLSMMNPLLHHGMILVGIPYSESALSTTKTGGTPYGASHVSGMESNQALSLDEISLAKALGERVAKLAMALAVPNYI